MVAAHDRGRRECPDPRDHGIRIGPVPDQVAQHECLVVAAACCVVETRVEGLEVRVDISEDEIAHAGLYELRASRRSVRRSARFQYVPASTRWCALGVRRSPDRIEPLELRADPPPAADVRRRALWRSGARAARQATPTTPSLLIIERFCGSTNVPPPVATTAWRASKLIDQHGPLDSAEVRLALRGKQRRDGLVLPFLDEIVDVDELPVEASREGARHSGLARAHETNEIHLVGFHATSRSSVSKKPGYEMTDGVGAVDARGVTGRQRCDGEGHGHAMVAARIGHAARGRPFTANDEAVGALVRVDAKGAESRNEDCDAIAFLDAEFSRPAHPYFAPVRRQRRNGRELVDEAGHFLRLDVDDTGAVAFNGDGAARLSAVGVGFMDLDARAKTPQDVDQRRARRVEADVVDLDARAG